MKEIFSSKLFTARKMAGFTLEALSKEASISKQTLSKYENGLVAPNSESLIKLSDALGVTIDYLLYETRTSLGLKNLQFREEFKMSEDEIERIKYSTLVKIENYLQLEKLANEVSDFVNPIEDLIIRNKRDAKKAASTLRKKWKLGNEPIRNVTDTLETKGIKIIELEFESSFEGLSGNFDKIPVIVVNTSIDEITRRRFTILHELSHLILQIDEEIFEDEELVEKLCNVFAGAILLPEDVMNKEFKNRKKIYVSELFELKRMYGASVQAILIRAIDMKLIPWDVYSKWQEVGSGYNTGRYNVEEKSERLLRLVFKCLSEGIITPNKAAKLANMKESDLNIKLKNYFELS